MHFTYMQVPIYFMYFNYVSEKSIQVKNNINTVKKKLKYF